MRTMNMTWLASALCGALAWVPGWAGAADVSSRTTQPTVRTLDFGVFWPPRDPSQQPTNGTQPLLDGQVVLWFEGLRETRPVIRLRVTLTRRSDAAARERWNSRLAFPEYDWMRQVRSGTPINAGSGQMCRTSCGSTEPSASSGMAVWDPGKGWTTISPPCSSGNMTRPARRKAKTPGAHHWCRRSGIRSARPGGQANRGSRGAVGRIHAAPGRDWRGTVGLGGGVGDLCGFHGCQAARGLADGPGRGWGHSGLLRGAVDVGH